MSQRDTEGEWLRGIDRGTDDGIIISTLETNGHKSRQLLEPELVHRGESEAPEHIRGSHVRVSGERHLVRAID
jgi:hypothetical protein